MIETILYLTINGKYQVVPHAYSGKLYRPIKTKSLSQAKIRPVKGLDQGCSVLLDHRRSPTALQNCHSQLKVRPDWTITLALCSVVYNNGPGSMILYIVL